MSSPTPIPNTTVPTSSAQSFIDYINPLPANTAEVFSKFEKILVCELNSGQFADYLRAKFPGRDIRKFNKVQGQPFLVSELVEAIQKEM